MFDRLQRALARREKTKIGDNTGILAAVLIPVFFKDGEYHILFTKRTDTVKTHKGDVCFPGGHYEPEDRSMLDTALRETNEEIGMPPRDIQIAGELDSTINASSGYIITSFVGFIPYPHTLKLETREIAEVLEVPIPFLLDLANLCDGTWEHEGINFPIQFYNYHDRIIWGATQRILSIFLPIWAAAAPGKDR
jgi:8-oxo-dGTP pyrophosphatase MutT (NUDIX family)